MKPAIRLFALSALVVAAMFNPARAAVIYTYTGNDFTYTTGSVTTTEHLTTTLTFATALSANMTYGQVIPTSFTFSDGAGDTFTGSTLSAGFYVQTDASGVIDGWYIGASSAAAYIQSQYTRYDGVQFDYISSSTGVGSTSNAAGTWAVSTTNVPEPASLALLGVGLLGLIAARRKPQA